MNEVSTESGIQRMLKNVYFLLLNEYHFFLFLEVPRALPYHPYTLYIHITCFQANISMYVVVLASCSQH